VSSESLCVGIQLPLRAFDIDVEFAVASGKCLALTGPSGSGKTTVLRAIAGLAAATGRIVCGGSLWLDSARGVEIPCESRGAGLVFQDGALFPHLSAWRNVAFGSAVRSDRKSAIEVLDRFGIGELAEKQPRELSGGECQRVALARALARRPTVLLLDEPLSALDARSRDAARAELSAVIAEIAVPVVLVTHDFVDASILGDQVAVLDRGRIIQRGTAESLTASPGSDFVAQMTGASVLRGTGTIGEDGLTTVELAGGSQIVSSDQLEGDVSIILAPWDIVLSVKPRSGASAQNSLRAEVVAVAQIGPRVRVTLATPQSLTAEITSTAAERLKIAPGRTLTAEFKATATRLVRRSA
jgi:molybdate transport system ATP-binding protein